jgi:elongation factor Ts
MAEITAAIVKELRDKTGAGMMDCKKALTENNGDMEAAIEFLRKKGIASAAKRADRAANEGRVDVYIHPGNKIGVLIEINCETDFVANTDDFKQLTHDIAMHIAAAAPQYLTREEVPADVINHEIEIYKDQARQQGKPDQILEKIATGKLDKFYSEICLMEQAYVRDPDKTIQGLMTEVIAKLGENMTIRRFTRYKIGE